MRFVQAKLQLLLTVLTTAIVLSPTAIAFAAGGACDPTPGSGFLGFPTWFQYLDGEMVSTNNGFTVAEKCQPVINGLNDIWKIVAAVLDILLRVASIAAIIFVLYGGVVYIISQGSPDKTKQALNTIINALVGLIITIIAAAVVGFIAGSF